MRFNMNQWQFEGIEVVPHWIHYDVFGLSGRILVK